MEDRIHELEGAISALRTAENLDPSTNLLSSISAPLANGTTLNDDSSGLELKPVAEETRSQPQGTLHVNEEAGCSLFYGPGGGSEVRISVSALRASPLTHPTVTFAGNTSSSAPQDIYLTSLITASRKHRKQTCHPRSRHFLSPRLPNHGLLQLPPPTPNRHPPSRTPTNHRVLPPTHRPREIPRRKLPRAALLDVPVLLPQAPHLRTYPARVPPGIRRRVWTA